MSLKIQPTIIYGADPELFLERDGKIVGSEVIVPEEGLKSGDSPKASVVRDGVQVELNPPQANSILTLGRNIGVAFEMLVRRIKKVDPSVSISFKDFVDVGRETLDGLSEASRILGCMPSKNIYGQRLITVDPKTYTKRSTGGHLHFGISQYGNNLLYNNKTDLIPEFDIFVGNMCVLIDRSVNAAERRENYGRAGEYREPEYGIEYRTLSNFWLRNYTLMSMVYGLSQIAISVVASQTLEAELIDALDIQNVIKAIDTNDFDLAMENFETVRPFLAKHLPKVGFVLTPENLDRFVVFAKGVREKGLESFFPTEPVTHWIGLSKGETATDFPTFLSTLY